MYESTLLWRVNIEISGFSIVYVRAYKPSVLFFRYIFTCYAEHEKKLSKKKSFLFFFIRKSISINNLRDG